MTLSLKLWALAAVQLLAAFAIDWYAVIHLGAGVQLDAAFAGMTIPTLVLQVVSGSLTFVLVPLLSLESPAQFQRIGWTFVVFVGALFTALVVVLGAAAAVWVPWIVPGFTPSAKALTVRMTQIQLLATLGTALNGVLVAMWQSRHRFVWPATVPILAATAASILLVLGLDRVGVELVAWCQVLLACGQTVLLAPILGRFQSPEWRAPELWEALRRMRPLLLGTTYYKTETLLTRFLASFLPAGSVTLLALAQRVLGAATNVITSGLSTPIVPQLALLAEAGKWQQFRALCRKHLGWMAWVTGAASLALLVFGEPLLRLVFERRDFTLGDVHALWLAILAMSGLLVGGGLGQIYSTTFYAQGNTATPTAIGVVGYTIGIGLRVLGLHVWGLYGIAIAVSAHYLLNVVLFEYRLRVRLGRLSDAREDSPSIREGLAGGSI